MENLSLTLAFLEQQPLAAARELEKLSAADTATFLVTAPSELAAPVISVMSPWFAADCLVRMPPPDAAALVALVEIETGVAMLRALPSNAAETISDQLPTSDAQRIRRLLKYASDSIGARMDPTAPSLRSGTSIKDALMQVRAMGKRVSTEIAVIDEDGSLVGIATLAMLFKANENVQLDTVIQRNALPLLDTALLGSARTNPDWLNYTALPVVDQSGRFLGFLHRRLLTLHGGTLGDQDKQLDFYDVFVEMGKAYLGCLAGLVDGNAEPQPHEER